MSALVEKQIVKLLLDQKRTFLENERCDLNCLKCLDSHLEKIRLAIQNNCPITFILPAFPCKSPNLSKVLGALPDFGEILALKNLQSLCEKIENVYAPGARIIICSDGRVFSDIIGAKEIDVSNYQKEISKIITEFNFKNLSLFNLDQVNQAKDFFQLRQFLMKNYGESYEQLRNKIQKGATIEGSDSDRSINKMYCGIIRFLFEDRCFGSRLESKKALHKIAKKNAILVIRRSNAWSRFIEEKFPSAVRLSIHPQSCGSGKFGIKLIKNEVWMTPWHGVVLKINNNYQIIKRVEAEKLGANLEFGSNGRPFLYTLSEINETPIKLNGCL